MKNMIFVRGLLAIMLLLVVGGFPGCGEKEQDRSKTGKVSGEDVKEEAMEAYGATKAYTQEQMQAFHEQMKTKLADYNDDIEQLQAKVEELGGDAKAKAEQQMTALRQKRDEASKKLQELSSSGGNAWEQLKSGIDAVMEDLGTAYKKVAAEFSKS
jgi:cell division septum initiation protein DivIVA